TNGTLSFASASNLGNATTSVLLGPGDSTHSGGLVYTGSTGVTFTRGVTLVQAVGTGAEIDVTNSSATVTLATSVAMVSSLTIGGAGNITTGAGVLFGPGTGNLTKTGAGTLTLNTANT